MLNQLPIASGPKASHSAPCPRCGQPGKPVPGQTVKALVSVSLRFVREGQYYFCRTQDCPVVYFLADGSSLFETSQLRERVYQKEPQAADVPICYCFQHTSGEVRDASPEALRSIIEEINAGIRAGQCACDLRNPQGTCCLNNVKRIS